MKCKIYIPGLIDKPLFVKVLDVVSGKTIKAVNLTKKNEKVVGEFILKKEELEKICNVEIDEIAGFITVVIEK